VFVSHEKLLSCRENSATLTPQRSSSRETLADIQTTIQLIIMTQLQTKLHDLLSNLEEVIASGKYRPEIVVQTRDKIKLYLKKFFAGNSEYDSLLNAVNVNPTTSNVFQSSINQLRSLINTLMEDIEMSETDVQSERQKIITDAKKEADKELKKIQAQAEEITKLKNDLQKRTESLLLEEEKLDAFKAKLEVADKAVDFQTDSKNNKMNAQIWIGVIILLIAVLIITICTNLNTQNSFSDIAIRVQGDFQKKNLKINSDVIDKTIYFTYSKFIFAKLLLYSIMIYGIKFAVKNYNAQMHNFVVNSHKANSFKSTLSLLDIAKSDDGNDKLLVQATQAIFSHQNSGFNANDSDANNSNLITNVIDGATKKM
jgi:ElaB/YqjD/DUF883 family membrane-anchored ribosome-binding protein